MVRATDGACGFRCLGCGLSRYSCGCETGCHLMPPWPNASLTLSLCHPILVPPTVLVLRVERLHDDLELRRELKGLDLGGVVEAVHHACT